MTRSPECPRPPTSRARAGSAARHALRSAGLLALALSSATCAPPVQGGNVVVSSGAAERLGMLCRWGRGGAEQGDLCPAAGGAVRPARVRRIAGPADALSGPLAAGRPGDYVLENDEIAVVVDQVGPGTGLAESGGNIIDAADARARRDELGQIVTRLGASPGQAIYSDLATGVGEDGTAWIEVRGRESAGGALSVTTRYALGPRDRALLITTSLRNDGDRPIEGLDLGDIVHWGAAEHVAPGAAPEHVAPGAAPEHVAPGAAPEHVAPGAAAEHVAPGAAPGLRGEQEAPYLAGIGTGVAYAIAPADGAKLRARSGAGFSDATFARPAALPPGGRADYRRILAVAPRGDTLAVETELFFLGGGAPGGVALELVDARGAPLPPLAGKATLTPIADDGAAPANAALDLWLRIDEGAPLAAEAPPGLYLVGFEGSGRRALGSARIRIRAGEIAPARLALSGAGRLDVRIQERGASAPAVDPDLRDPLTATKVSLFDAATGKAVSPPRLALMGELDVSLPPGRVRVVASRGPEYALAEATVDIADGGRSRLDLTLERVVDTSGYIACDLRQHTAKSADAGVPSALRLLWSAAEGVECAVASEHNLASDLQRDVAALRLEARLRMLPGVELTSGRSGAGIGSLSVFPLGSEADAPREGALRWVGETASEILREVRALPGERVVQVSRQHGGGSPLHGSGAPQVAPDQGPSPLAQIVGDGAGADAVEVWTGRDAAARDRALEELWALLRASRPVTPTATSDSHGLHGAEAGTPRTYIAVADDDPGRLDVAELVAGLRHRRDVVITNGPFVTVRLGDTRQGGVASARRGTRGGPQSLSIRVERAPWVDARELHVLVGGVASGAPIPLEGARTTPAGALLDEIEIPVVLGPGGGRRPPRPDARADAARGGRGSGQSADRGPGQSARGAISIAEDTFVVAIVRGRRPLEPVLAGDPGGILPFAMTAPLWIDADGDGRSLGRAAAP
ncbi:CehA/McbA family metallohydrolase [Sorangium sp. So ce375]|uniref:CehA/McbA family metallohydrolase n=1 Tax=Sorangium sp. So ce375 TaxID=3133306 RepID=UPI003F5B8B0B